MKVSIETIIQHVNDLKEELSDYIANNENATNEKANNFIVFFGSLSSNSNFLALSFPTLEIEVADDFLEMETLAKLKHLRSVCHSEVVGLGFDPDNADAPLRMYIAASRLYPEKAGTNELEPKKNLVEYFLQENLRLLSRRQEDNASYPVYATDENGLITDEGQILLKAAILKTVEFFCPEPDAAGNPVSLGVLLPEHIQLRQNKDQPDKKQLILSVQPTTTCAHMMTGDSLLCKAIKVAAETALPKGCELQFHLIHGVHPFVTFRRGERENLETLRDTVRRTASYMLASSITFGKLQTGLDKKSSPETAEGMQPTQ